LSTAGAGSRRNGKDDFREAVMALTVATLVGSAAFA
jgi:hypothetical protein